MTKPEVLHRIRSYITDNFLYTRPDFQLEDGDSLMEAGVLDSMAAMELIAFAEQEFAIIVRDEDVTEEHFGSIEAIGAYVIGRCAAGEIAPAQ